MVQLKQDPGFIEREHRRLNENPTLNIKMK